MASEIAGVSTACSTVYSGADQMKHQSSASLRQWPVETPHKGKWRAVTTTIFEIKVFAFAKTRLHYFNHFFKDQWVAIMGLVNILDVMGRK